MDSMMKKTILTIGLCGLLAACNAMPAKKAEMPCPSAGLLPRADTITLRQDPSQGFDAGNVAARARFGNYRGSCRVNAKGGIDFTVQYDIMVSKSPQNTNKTQELPYFIGVLTPDDDIVRRDAFVTKIEYNDKGEGRTQDTHVVNIPVNDSAAAAKYKVVTGFILTPAQRDFNFEAASNLKSKEAILNVR